MLYFGMRAIKLHSVKRTCRYEVLLVVTGTSQCCQPSESRADCVCWALSRKVLSHPAPALLPECLGVVGLSLQIPGLSLRLVGCPADQ